MRQTLRQTVRVVVLGVAVVGCAASVLRDADEAVDVASFPAPVNSQQTAFAVITNA